MRTLFVVALILSIFAGQTVQSEIITVCQIGEPCKLIIINTENHHA